MNIEKPQNTIEAEKVRYEKLLWQKAEELAVIRQALQSRITELETELGAENLERLNLHQRDLRREKEDEYWRIRGKIDALKIEEDKIQQALVNLESGGIDKSALELLIDRLKDENEESLSKRKRRLLEEKQYLGVDPREIMHDMYGEFGSEKMHLTTGRHAQRVKNLGQMTPAEAASEFFYRSTDTHGGKTKVGKKGDRYVSKSGKYIRKA